jgi:ABC-type uncharacterized transport system permease subunit
MVVERSGVLNLGVEGMMIIGAIGGFITAVQTGSPVLGFVGGALAGAALERLIFALLTQVFLANQVATGLALTLFGLGVSSLAGQGYNGIKPPATGKVPFGPLADIPVLGRSSSATTGWSISRWRWSRSGGCCARRGPA